MTQDVNNGRNKASAAQETLEGSEQGANTTRCQACRELIIQGARKCVHCSAFQNWRRYFSVSETVLALLVALIAVIGSVGPPLVRTFEPPYSDTMTRFLAVEKDRLTLIFSNQGNATSFVRRAQVYVLREQDPFAVSQQWATPGVSQEIGFQDSYDDVAEFLRLNLDSTLVFDLALLDASKAGVERGSSRLVSFRKTSVKKGSTLERKWAAKRSKEALRRLRERQQLGAEGRSADEEVEKPDRHLARLALPEFEPFMPLLQCIVYAEVVEHPASERKAWVKYPCAVRDFDFFVEIESVGDQGRR